MLRLAFTAALALVVVACGLAVGAAWHPLAPEIAHRVAFAPVDLRTGSWHRLITSLAFTSGPAAFWKVLWLVVVSCGIYEWRRGTRATAVGFAFLHLATLVLSSLALLAGAAAGWRWAADLVVAYDVGPSAGCYGCFGLVIGDVATRWRLILLAGFVTVAAVNLILHLHAHDATELASDGEHALAIALGWLCHPRAPRLPMAEVG